MKNASHTYEISLFTSICPKILHRLLKDRVSMLSRLWKCEELVWIQCNLHMAYNNQITVVANLYDCADCKPT